MAPKTVTLTHPKLKGRTITVAASSVRVYERSGWKTAPKAQQPKTETDPKSD